MRSTIELSGLLADLPMDEQNLRYYPSNSRGKWDDWDDYDDEENSSAGRFTHIPIGMSVDDEVESDWDGGCFACWSSLAPHDLMTSISYQNILPECTPTTTELKAFLAEGWDTVIRPCFGDNLPPFERLLGMTYLPFPDTRTRSLMEASFYFRLARSYGECLSFPVTASILRDRYPDTSAAVLLALTCFSPMDEHGITGEMYRVDPNQTMPGEHNVGFCLALMRNFLWAEEQGGWRIERLNQSASTAGPLSRRYYGHDYFWSGAGEYFHVNLEYRGTGSRSDNRRDLVWSAIGSGWDKVDALHGIFLNAEAEAKELAISEPLDVSMNLADIPGGAAALARLSANRNRNW